MLIEKDVKIQLDNNEVEMLGQLLEFARIYMANRGDSDRGTWAAKLTLSSEKQLNELQEFMNRLFEI